MHVIATSEKMYFMFMCNLLLYRIANHLYNLLKKITIMIQ